MCYLPHRRCEGGEFTEDYAVSVLAGLMASAPLSNTAESIADLWNDRQRAFAVVG